MSWNMFRAALLAALALCLVQQEARAQFTGAGVSLSDTIANAPVATEPFSPTDAVPIIQSVGGRNLTHKWLPQTSTLSMLPDASNALTTSAFGFGSGLYPQYAVATVTTANTTSGSPTITVNSATGISIGDVISTASPDFLPAPGNTTYVVNIVGTTVTLSGNATSSNTGASVTFGVDRFTAGSTLLTNTSGVKYGYFGSAAVGKTTWPARYWSAGDFPADHNLYSIATQNQAALFAARASDNPSGGYVITEGTLSLDDDGAIPHFTEAKYIQSNLTAFSPGSTHIQVEQSIANTGWGTPATLDPYTTNASGMIVSLRPDCGVGPASDNCSAAVQFVNNGAAYGAGVIFDSTSVAADINGISSAIELPKNYSIDFFSAAGTAPWRLYSNATTGNNQLILGDNSVTLDVAGSEAIFHINAVTAGQSGYVSFDEAGVQKWLFGKQTDNSLFGYDVATTANWLTVGNGGAGNTVLGESGKTTTVNGLVATNAALTTPTLTDPIMPGFVVSTSTLTKTTDTALATVPGLSVALTAGKTYNCHGHLTGAQAGGGLKLEMVGTGGLTATSASFTAELTANTIITQTTTVTALGTDMAGFFDYTNVYIDGAIVVNAGGTINVQAAQNTSDGAATTILVNSTFQCVRVN